VVAAVVVLAAVANHLALAAGWGIVGVAIATTVAYACYWGLAVGVSFWIDLPPGERLRHLGMTCLAVLPTLAVAWPLARIEASGSVDWPSLAARTAAVACVWFLSAAIAWHVGGWREQLARTKS
jgi:hypothetical protein